MDPLGAAAPEVAPPAAAGAPEAQATGVAGSTRGRSKEREIAALQRELAESKRKEAVLLQEVEKAKKDAAEARQRAPLEFGDAMGIYGPYTNAVREAERNKARAKTGREDDDDGDSRVGSWLPAQAKPTQPKPTAGATNPTETPLAQFRAYMQTFMRGGADSRWAYKDFTRNGNNYFMMRWAPRSDADLRFYVANWFTATARVPPFQHRLTLLSQLEGVRGSFDSFVRYMASDPEVVPECQDPIAAFGDALREFVAQFHIIGPGACGGIPFSCYLGMGYMSHQQASARMKEGLLDYRGVSSVITANMRGGAGESFWNDSLPEGINTGMDIQSLEQYLDLCRRARETARAESALWAAPAPTYAPARTQVANRSTWHPPAPSAVGSLASAINNHRSVSQAPSAVASPTVAATPIPAPADAKWGKIPLRGRCYACGYRTTHRKEHCPNPHPLHKKDGDELYVAKLLTTGHIPFPN